MDSLPRTKGRLAGQYEHPSIKDDAIVVFECALKDAGPEQKLLQIEPDGPIGVDYLICEAAYGDRDRSDVSRESRRVKLSEEVRRATEQRGPLVIPSFAVERTQELLVDRYLLHAMARDRQCQFSSIRPSHPGPGLSSSAMPLR